MPKKKTKKIAPRGFSRKRPQKIVINNLKDGKIYRIKAIHVLVDEDSKKIWGKERVDGIYCCEVYNLALSAIEDQAGGDLEMLDDDYLLLTRKDDECTLLKSKTMKIAGLTDELDVFDDGSVMVGCSAMLGKDMEKFCREILKRRGYKCVKRKRK